MKTKNKKTIMYAGLFFFATLIISCSKDDNSTPPDADGKLVVGNGVTENDFEKFKGELGIVLNMRNIAKKGYKPAEAIITVNAQNGNYSQTVAIDPVSFLAQLKIPVEGLSEQTIAELRNGVPIDVEITDENNNTIISQDVSAVIFKENPQESVLNVVSLNETPENLLVSLKENTPYYLQKVTDEGKPENKAARVNRTAGFSNIVTISTNNNFAGENSEPDFVFLFVPIPNEPNTYAIKLKSNNQYISVGTTIVGLIPRIAPRLTTLTNFSQVQSIAEYENFKFVIRKDDDGIYSLVSKPYNQAVREMPGVGLTIGGGNPIYFRIISNSLEWTAESIGTTFLTPILASPSTDFGANSTLTNCGTGSLSQTVGNNQSISITNSVGWEERFSFTGTTSTSVSTTVGAEFEAGFFGTSATYNASVTASLEASVSMTEESAAFGGKEETLSETIFFERTVTVPPGKASLVYDVAQIYSDTKVPFVQRFRLRASESGNALTGEELRSQLQFSRFSGVVTQTGIDFIDITVKGTAILGKVLEARSEVKDVPSNCN